MTPQENNDIFWHNMACGSKKSETGFAGFLDKHDFPRLSLVKTQARATFITYLKNKSHKSYNLQILLLTIYSKKSTSRPNATA